MWSLGLHFGLCPPRENVELTHHQPWELSVNAECFQSQTFLQFLPPSLSSTITTDSFQWFGGLVLLLFSRMVTFKAFQSWPFHWQQWLGHTWTSSIGSQWRGQWVCTLVRWTFCRKEQRSVIMQLWVHRQPPLLSWTADVVQTKLVCMCLKSSQVHNETLKPGILKWGGGGETATAVHMISWWWMLSESGASYLRISNPEQPSVAPGSLSVKMLTHPPDKFMSKSSATWRGPCCTTHLVKMRPSVSPDLQTRGLAHEIRLHFSWTMRK